MKKNVMQTLPSETCWTEMKRANGNDEKIPATCQREFQSITEFCEPIGW
jgi:predicted amidophosphoribosyltransferase